MAYRNGKSLNRTEWWSAAPETGLRNGNETYTQLIPAQPSNPDPRDAHVVPVQHRGPPPASVAGPRLRPGHHSAEQGERTISRHAARPAPVPMPRAFAGNDAAPVPITAARAAEPVVAGLPQAGAPTLDLPGALRRSWLSILLATVVAGVAVAVAVAMQPRTYTSEAAVQISADDSTLVLTGAATQTSNDRTRVVNTEASVMTSDAMIEPTSSAVGRDPVWVREHVQVATAKDSDVLTITAVANSASDAQRLASVLTETYQRVSKQQGAQALEAQAKALQGPIEALKASISGLPLAAVDERAAFGDQLGKLSQQQEQIRSAAGVYPGQARILTAATLPLRPSSISVPIGTGAGAALGLMIGIAVAVGRRSLSVRRRARTGPS